MGECPRASLGCEESGGVVGRMGITEDKVFYEGAEEENDGELAEKEALGEGESGVC